MATMVRRTHQRAQPRTGLPNDFGLGLVVTAVLLFIAAFVLFLVLNFDTTGPRTEGQRLPEGAFQETSVPAPSTIAAQ